MRKKNLLLYVLYLLSTIILLFGLGYIKEWNNENLIVAILFLCCYIFGSKNRYTLLILLISFAFLSLYFPTGIIYGIPSPDIINPLLHTNNFEIIGYLRAIKYHIFVSIVFILMQLTIYWITEYNLIKNKSITFISIIVFMIFYILSIYGVSFHHHRLNKKAFLRNVIISYTEIKVQQEETKKYINDSSNLKIKILDKDDKTEVRVVIIGESVRKDFLSVYGYPLNTTPYLNTANGIFVDGLVAAAPNTEMSLTRTLFKTYPDKDKIDWGINFVSLANNAGYTTYWLSNQGTKEYGDDIFSALARSANNFYFLKTGRFDSKNTDDDDMLPIFSKILSTNTIKKKVIFIHMIGSHPPACPKLENFQSNIELNNEVGCYAATIEKLDYFIKNVVERLKGKTYKLMYFSDHGLVVEKYREFHHPDYFESYQVPFIYTDSEIKKHISFKKIISGLNLIDFYADFINIKTNVTNEHFSFTNLPNLKDNTDPIIYWQKYKHLSSIKMRQPPSTDIEKIKMIELKKNYKYSNECINYIDTIIEGPINKILGWAASSENNKPLNGKVGVFIIDKNKILFIPGYQTERDDVREHFKIQSKSINKYGIVSLVNKKYNLNQARFGYKTESNQYIICKKL